MRSPLLSVFLCFAIQLQSLSAKYELAGSAIEDLRDSGSSSVQSQPVVSSSDKRKRVGDLQSADSEKVFEELHKRYWAANNALLVLDIGGVLRPREDFPVDVIEHSKSIVRRLTARLENQVWLNTARGLSSVHRSNWGDDPNLNLAGGLGVEIQLATHNSKFIEGYPNMKEQLPAIYEKMQPALDKFIGEGRLLEKVTLLPSAIVIWRNKGVPADEMKEIQPIVENVLGDEAFKDYHIHDPFTNSRMRSVSHKDAGKETLVNHLLKNYKDDPKPFVLAIGDDSVDEKVMELLSSEGYYPITTSPNPEHLTFAKYRLPSYVEVQKFLFDLSEPPEMRAERLKTQTLQTKSSP